LLAATPGWTQGRPSDRALAPLVACRPIADVRARAACYDSALDRLQQSVAERTVVVMDREQVKEDRKTSFGFASGQALARVAAPKPTRTTRAVAKVEDVAAIDSTVVSVAPFGPDRWTIRIATGALWRTSEPGTALAPRPGMAVHIRRGVMGSYMMRVGDSGPTRAKRVN
jgi:hypothetical protein